MKYIYVVLILYARIALTTAAARYTVAKAGRLQRRVGGTVTEPKSYFNRTRGFRLPYTYGEACV